MVHRSTNECHVNLFESDFRAWKFMLIYYYYVSTVYGMIIKQVLRLHLTTGRVNEFSLTIKYISNVNGPSAWTINHKFRPYHEGESPHIW